MRRVPKIGGGYNNAVDFFAPYILYVGVNISGEILTFVFRLTLFSGAPAAPVFFVRFASRVSYFHFDHHIRFLLLFSLISRTRSPTRNRTRDLRYRRLSLPLAYRWAVSLSLLDIGNIAE